MPSDSALWLSTDLFHCRIGAYGNNNGPMSRFSGAIDEVLVYERKLSPQEIALLSAQ